MLRRLTVTALALGSLALPRGAAAAPPGMPLWTLCSSPTMDYCASFWTYDVETLGDESSGYVARWHSRITLFGNGYDGYDGGFYAETYANFVDGCRIGLYSGPPVNGPGEYEIGDVSGGGCYATPTVPAITDMTLLHFTLGRGVDICRPSVDCYEVSEPSSLLLLATGGLCFALLGWRRRRTA